MKKKLFCIVFFSLGFSLNSFALSEIDFNKTLDKSIRSAEKNKNFQVHFKQEIYSILRDKISVSSGNLSVREPNLFRFEVTEPRSELYVSNGSDFWKYVPSLKHAQHLKTQTGEFGFIKLLTDLSYLKKTYKTTEWTNSEAKMLNQKANLPAVESELPPALSTPHRLAIKLDPKGDKSQKVLYAIVDVKTGFIEELRIVQLNGNRTRLVFTGYEVKPLPMQIFQFKPPSGIVVNDAS